MDFGFRLMMALCCLLVVTAAHAQTENQSRWLGEPVNAEFRDLLGTSLFQAEIGKQHIRLGKEVAVDIDVTRPADDFRRHSGNRAVATLLATSGKPVARDAFHLYLTGVESIVSRFQAGKRYRVKGRFATAIQKSHSPSTALKSRGSSMNQILRIWRVQKQPLHKPCVASTNVSMESDFCNWKNHRATSS